MNILSNKSNAFTLAEVLVTLGVIGIVSTLTIPTLVQNYQKKSYVTQLHKVYSEISQACERYKADKNLVSLRESKLVNNQTELKNFMNTYFKVVKDCGNAYYSSSGNSCFAQYYSSLDGSSQTNMASSQCMVVVTLANGVAICADSGNIEDSTVNEDVNGDGVVDENDKAHAAVGTWDDSVVITFEVDINGPKGPNKMGRDMFTMDVNSNGLVYDKDWTSSSTIDKTHAWPVGIGKIVEDGWEMNY